MGAQPAICKCAGMPQEGGEMQKMERLPMQQPQLHDVASSKVPLQARPLQDCRCTPSSESLSTMPASTVGGRLFLLNLQKAK